MTRKEELFAEYAKVKDKVSNITLFIKMPTGETEIISNPRVLEKMAYIDKTYNDDLVHSNCDKIQIENYVFEIQEDTMDFGSAILNLKKGHKVARKGWNGRGMFVYYVPSGKFKPYTVAGESLIDEDGLVSYEPYFAIKNVKGTVSTWVPSINDCLAEDWIVVK